MNPSTGLMGDSVGFREKFVSSATTRRVLGLSKSVYIIGSYVDGLKNTVSALCKVSESR
jgi:hypothetical protein